MIIVTGGAGFIGSNIVRKLNREGITDILIVDNLSKAVKHRNLNALDFTDFIDKHSFFDRLPHLGNIETVFHQGACSSTTETDGKYMMSNNYAYSKRLLHFCLEHTIDFLYASSASVYGGGEDGFREHRQCEYPLNVYAFSKYLFDRYVRRTLKKQELSSQVLGLRYFNVYGPQENHKGDMASVMFKFYSQLKQGGKMGLFEGSENFRRDFIFVEDVAAVNWYFFQHKTSGIYNCGTGQARSFSDIAHIVQQVEAGAQIEMIPFPEDLKGKYQTFTEADIAKLRSSGYQQDFFTLEEGVKKYYELLKKQDGYFRKLETNVTD
jgi:ADP-L-glycero-D-manno-heptose 6-epimerase